MEKYYLLNLHLFDGEAAGGGAAGGTSGAPAPAANTGAGNKEAAGGKANRHPLANVKYGIQPQADAAAKQQSGTIVTTDTEDARKAEFDRLIKGEYKDLYDANVQRNINARFRDITELKTKAAQLDALDPIISMLAQRYGVDGKDMTALSKAIEDDDGYYEDEAMAKGLTVEQLKAVKKLERENADFRRVAQERERQQNADRIYAMWQQQGEECKKVYPGFDFQTEVDPQKSPTAGRFLDILKSGVDVKTAYMVVHMDDIMGGAMQYTAQQISQKTVNDIKARGMRPSENGASGASAAAIVKTDPKTFTKKDREEISRRVMRGERIVL